MPFRRTLDMAITREDFLRRLASVIDGYEVDGGLVRWRDAGRTWTIRLVALPERRIGSVALRRHRVEVDLDTCTESEGEAFLARLRKGFLRGGG